MFKLRPRYWCTIAAVFIGAPFFGYIIYDNFYSTDYFVIFFAVLISVLAIVIVSEALYVHFHTLKFNTKEFIIKKQKYTFEQIEKVDVIGYNYRHSDLHIFVDGKSVFYFGKGFRHFFDFKAVLEEKGIKISYF